MEAEAMDLEARAFVKRNGALWPSDEAADEYLAAIPDGREVLVRANRPRSVPHHRWFFALLRKVVRAEDQWADEEDLLDDLKDATGHVQAGRINPLTGQPRRKTRSINFASMGEDKFRRFKDRCIYVLCKRLGYDPLVLMEEVDATQRNMSMRHETDQNRRCA
jgi:hypothetical protein